MSHKKEAAGRVENRLSVRSILGRIRRFQLRARAVKSVSDLPNSTNSSKLFCNARLTFDGRHSRKLATSVNRQFPTSEPGRICESSDDG
jgi:hypothetical protein